jgi:hypothetical protein
VVTHGRNRFLLHISDQFCGGVDTSKSCTLWWF